MLRKSGIKPEEEKKVVRGNGKINIWTTWGYQINKERKGKQYRIHALREMRNYYRG